MPESPSLTILIKSACQAFRTAQSLGTLLLEDECVTDAELPAFVELAQAQLDDLRGTLDLIQRDEFQSEPSGTKNVCAWLRVLEDVVRAFPERFDLLNVFNIELSIRIRDAGLHGIAAINSLQQTTKEEVRWRWPNTLVWKQPIEKVTIWRDRVFLVNPATRSAYISTKELDIAILARKSGLRLNSPKRFSETRRWLKN